MALYFSLGAGVIIISHLVFSYFGFLHTDVDSARYMLSALIQSEAAIVALVVTLSLVAVQLAAQSYSARVIEVFRRAPDLWILMGIYGIAIFYGLGVLKLIENPLVGRLSNLEGHVSFAYYLGVFAFVALVPYMWNTFEMLKPSTVINILANKITKENIKKTFGFKGYSYVVHKTIEEKFERDPLQPIIDIARGSLMKYDYETVKIGLAAISKRTTTLFENETSKDSWMGREEDIISLHVFSHYEGLAELAASKNNEDSTLAVIFVLEKNGITAANKKLKNATTNAIRSLKKIIIFADEQKFKKAELKANESVLKIYEKATKQELELPKDILFPFRKSGKGMAKENHEEREQQTVESLEKLIKISEVQVKTTQQVVEYLEKIDKALSKTQK
ncbi:MAG: DUF2254 domain-containing protein [Candidatus Methanoperedens sp.]|nr:DUF2254 domain-containing protein [Candidatus Methanoperedens sp.]